MDVSDCRMATTIDGGRGILVRQRCELRLRLASFQSIVLASQGKTFAIMAAVAGMSSVKPTIVNTFFKLRIASFACASESGISFSGAADSKLRV